MSKEDIEKSHRDFFMKVVKALGKEVNLDNIVSDKEGMRAYLCDTPDTRKLHGNYFKNYGGLGNVEARLSIDDSIKSAHLMYFIPLSPDGDITDAVLNKSDIVKPVKQAAENNGFCCFVTYNKKGDPNIRLLIDAELRQGLAESAYLEICKKIKTIDLFVQMYLNKKEQRI